MKTSPPPESMSHPGDLLLPYAENSLPAGDARSVEQHLSECPECSATVEKLAETIQVLKAHKEAFCPEPWELYEFVLHGEDPDEYIEKHIQRCEPCRSLADIWTTKTGSEMIPESVLTQIRDRSEKEKLHIDKIINARARFRERIFKRFVFPGLGIGAVAAAVLSVFLLMPQDIPQSLIAPSAVTWEKVPKPKAFDTSRYRTAVVVALKGFPTRWPQARIDSLYHALAPTMELSQHFDILPPEVVSKTILKERRGLRTEQDMVALLRQKLDVKRVAVVVVSPSQDQLRIQGEFIDTQGAVSLNRTKTEMVAKDELDSRIKQMVTELMTSNGK